MSDTAAPGAVKTHGRLTYHAFPPGESVRWRQAVWQLAVAPYVAIKAKRLFPRADPYRDGSIVIGHTDEVARDLEWLVQRYPLEMTPETAERLGRHADQHRQREQTIHEIVAGYAPPLPILEPARPARAYQQVASDLACTTGALLLADDVGLGKSMSGILTFGREHALPALVVTLTHLPSQWVSEVRKTYPDLRCHIVNRMQPYPLDEIDVIVMPYSKLRGWSDHLAGHVRTVVFDEVQELRRSGSQKWMAAAQIADQAELVIGLTATPVYNYGDEVHTIYEVLAPGRLGNRDEFLREWGGASRVGFGQHATIADPAALGLYLRDQGLLLRRTRKEVGRELPDVIRIPHTVESDEELLESMVDDALDLAEIIVTRAASRQELWQASGEFDWKMRQATGIAKAPYVAEFVKLLLEANEQVVLFGWHRAVYEIWLERLATFDPVLYTGTESPAAKERNARAFLDGYSRLLIMSLRAGAGLDGLQDVAHVAVFGELDWAPAIHTQCIGRLHRDGQPEPVVAYFLVSDHGADPKIAEVLELKTQQAEPILDPDQPLFTPVANVGDRIKELARDVLERRRRRHAS